MSVVFVTSSSCCFKKLKRLPTFNNVVLCNSSPSTIALHLFTQSYWNHITCYEENLLTQLKRHKKIPMFYLSIDNCCRVIVCIQHFAVNVAIVSTWKESLNSVYPGDAMICQRSTLFQITISWKPTALPWLVACSVPSHYLDQCWLIVNWTLRNKLHRNSNKSTQLSFMKMSLKMLFAKWCPRGRWVNLRWVLVYDLSVSKIKLNPINWSINQSINLSIHPSILNLFKLLTHWGQVTHTCVGNLTIIGSDNGLSPGRRQAII